MKERAVGFDAVRFQFIDEAFVKRDSFLVWRSGALREDSRPSDGKTIDFGSERFQKFYVFFAAVIIIIGDISRLVVCDLPRNVREGVPDRRPSAVLVNAAFDLVGCRRATPEKSLWK